MFTSSRSASWWYPILFVLLLTPFTPYLDLHIARFFYSSETQSFMQNPFLKFWFDYGEWPSWLAVLLSIMVWFWACCKPSYQRWKRPALIMLLSFAIGAGLITNVLLKGYWGRPRPRQIEAFGGSYPFSSYYIPHFRGDPINCKSFPCGHCATGFYFLTLIPLGRRLGSKRWEALGWILGLGLGITLSVVRIQQGAHFFSDVLFAALIMWLTALSLDAAFFKKHEISKNLSQ